MEIRQMHLCTRTANTTHGLELFVTYLVQVYSVIWFSIKSKSKFTYAPSHLFKLMTLIQLLPEEIQGVVKPVVYRNAYHAV